MKTWVSSVTTVIERGLSCGNSTWKGSSINMFFKTLLRTARLWYLSPRALRTFLLAGEQRKHKVLDDDEFTEVFELAAPGKDYEVYTKSHFTRKD